jgi:hypothetical protein
MCDQVRAGIFGIVVFACIAGCAPAHAAEEWTPLFNGKDLSGWETYLGKPYQQTDPVGVNKDPSGVFKVEDGAIHVSGEVFGVVSTVKEYENYRLRLEVKWGERRWPPRAEKKRDAGILYHAFGEFGSHGPWTKSQEFQIQEGDFGDYYALQTVAAATVKRDEKPFKTYDPAGVFQDQANGPIVKSEDHEKPRGEWNVVEVVCNGDTSTHIVNGHVVNVLTNARKREGDNTVPLTKGKIQLQSEGAEVFYRKIEVRPLTADEMKDTPAKPALLPNAPPATNNIAKIFNGKDLSGWEGDTRLWRVENETIVGETTDKVTTNSNTFLIYRGADGKGSDIKDFELRLSFRIHGGNSGVQYRSHVIDSGDPANTWRVSGYQAEIADLAGKDGFLYHEMGDASRGYPEKSRYLCYVGDKVAIGEDGKSKSVGTLAPKEALAATYRKGEWNDYIIIARGNVIKHFLNGYQVVEVTDDDPKNAPTSGLIALQIHKGPPMKIEFRDIRLKSFDAAR